MSENKQAHIRYKVLDKCFSNIGRKYFIEDLLEECNRVLEERNGIGKGIKIRQIRQDITDMEDIYGFILMRKREGRKVYYQYEDPHYSINNSPLNETEIKQLKTTLAMFSKFKGMPQFLWIEEILARLESEFNLRGEHKSIVAFEQNPYLKGLNLLPEILNAIINKQALIISYHRFGKESHNYLVHPYFLKQYNDRWFLFSGSKDKSDKDSIITFALDRIDYIKTDNTPYVENTKIDFEEYFEDVIGITVLDKKIEKVVLQVDNTIMPYIETKPLHGSQKTKQKDRDTTTIELELIINYELENLLLSYIDKIKVISPEHFKQKIIKRIKTALSINS